MSLKEKLDDLTATRSEAWRAVYQDFVETLSSAGTIDRMLQPGDRMPEFTLANADGRLVSSDKLLAEGPVVLTFFRGEWCPWCDLMLRALDDALPDIVSAGGRLVALSPETSGRSLAVKNRCGLGYEVLCDMDNGIALTFGVAFRLPEPYRLRLVAAGIDLADSHGNDAAFLPIPACFIIDDRGVIRMAFADVDFTHRAEPAAIVAALKSLREG